MARKENDLRQALAIVIVKRGFRAIREAQVAIDNAYEHHDPLRKLFFTLSLPHVCRSGRPGLGHWRRRSCS